MLQLLDLGHLRHTQFPGLLQTLSWMCCWMHCRRCVPECHPASFPAQCRVSCCNLSLAHKVLVRASQVLHAFLSSSYALHSSKWNQVLARFWWWVGSSNTGEDEQPVSPLSFLAETWLHVALSASPFQLPTAMKGVHSMLALIGEPRNQACCLLSQSDALKCAFCLGSICLLTTLKEWAGLCITDLAEQA